MELLEWRDEYATGISGIDYEHEQLIQSINSFYSSLADNSDNEVLVDTLNDIYAAIYSHFVLEEKLMEKYHYDQYEQHRDDHARLLDEIRDITIGLEGAASYDEQGLREMLNDWFAVHFRTHDARLHNMELKIHSKIADGEGFLAQLKAIVGGIFLKH